MRQLGALLVSGLMVFPGCSKDQSGEIAQLKREIVELKELAGPPPGSLDSLYPPKTPAPHYQLEMFELAAPLTGLVMKMSEGDRKGAKEFFDVFKTRYLSISKSVPEWEQAFPAEPVEELGAMIEQGEPGRVMEAVGRVGTVCHDCHVVNMPKVQQQYHWGDFSVISLSDPATNRTLDFNQFMMSLDMSFVGISMELQRGHVDKARKHFETFKSGLSQLKETCQTCHDSERKYFVDAEIDALLSRLGALLRPSMPDMKLVGDISQQIGVESCGKCHLVHIPAAYAKARWKKWAQSPK